MHLFVFLDMLSNGRDSLPSLFIVGTNYLYPTVRILAKSPQRAPDGDLFCFAMFLGAYDEKVLMFVGRVLPLLMKPLLPDWLPFFVRKNEFAECVAVSSG